LPFPKKAALGCGPIFCFSLSIRQQLQSRDATAGHGLAALALAGILEAFGSEANFSEGHHPSRVLGYFLLAAAAVIFLTTAERWKRVFPGIMLAATLGALSVLEQGHALNNPALLVPVR